MDEILKQVFDDHCKLRLYLAHEQFIVPDRRRAVYWRVGGTVS